MAQKVQGRQNIVKSYSFLLLFLFFLTDNQNLPEKEWEEEHLFNPTSDFNLHQVIYIF